MCRAVCYILINLAILVAVSGYEAIDYRKYLSPEELNQLQNGGTYEFDHFNKTLTELVDKPTCTKPGTMCGSCETVFECIQIGGSFIVEQLDDCPKGSTCVAATGTCTTESNPDCDLNPTDYVFTCRQVGIFPDAYKCTIFHICLPDSANSMTVNAMSIPQTCNTGFYYDAKTSLCRNILKEGTNCPAMFPTCGPPGTAGRVPNNPSLYYICLRSENSTTYSPQMFSCIDNGVYDLKSKMCVDPTPKTGVDDEGMCLRKGNFYDPKTVFKYSECSEKGLSPVSKDCASRQRFYPVDEKCVDMTRSDFEW